MNKIFTFISFLLPLFFYAQTTSDLEKELDQVKNLRAKDSAKIELLIKEIKNLIDIKENNQKDEILKQLKKEDSLNLVKRKQEIESYKAKTEGLPVIFQNDTLYNIYTALGPFQPTDRVAHDLSKIITVYNSNTFNKDSLKIVESENLVSLIYNNNILTSITDLDALWIGKSPNQLAKEYKDNIGNAIKKHQKANSFKFKLIRYGQLLLFIIALFILFQLINRVINFFKTKISKNDTFLANGIKVKNYQLFKREQLNLIIDKFFDVLKFILYIITIFSIVPLALKLFPQTSVWVDDVRIWLEDPLISIKNAIFNYIPNLIKIALIIAIGRFIIRSLKFFSIEIARENLVIKGFYPEWASPTFSLIRFVLNIFILIIVFPLLPGADSVAFKGVSVFLGVLISIGSSSAISNAVSGLVITYMRPFKVGDWIKTKSIVGVVIEKNVLVTRLRTFNNEDITVPNSSILNDHTINYSSIGKKKGLALSVRLKTRYDYNANIIEQRLIEAALRTNNITKDIPPYVLQVDFGDLSATYELNAYTFDPDNMFFTRSDLARNIRNVFEEANIKFVTTTFVELKTVDELTNSSNKTNKR
nr:mechanosensitive ion channel domain-containing protein [uncultured Flavobacterium sp.]